MHAVMVSAPGGPEVLDYSEQPDPVAGPGEILIRNEAIGLNFVDIYQRTGLYPGEFPRILGSEAAGTVEVVGPGVTRFKVGDRAAFVGGPASYAELSAVKADRAFHVAPGVSAKVAAASGLKGLTAEYLTRIWPVGPGDTVLLHAAAGGVGTLLSQWLAHLGVRVIGTVGSAAKAKLARAQGCAEVILYDQEDVATRVRELTGGAGVKVVYDSVGKSTFDASLASLQRRGLMVTFGNASGPVPPVEPIRLSRAGSLFLTRPTLYDYIATTDELDAAAARLSEVITSGVVTVKVDQEWPLSKVQDAHRAMAARETTGASVMIP